MTSFEVGPVGHVASSLTSPGDRLVLLTWLDRADRETLAVHPRGDLSRPLTGVFATRSSARPNPIGLHDVQVLEVDCARVHVRNLEAVTGPRFWT